MQLVSELESTPFSMGPNSTQLWIREFNNYRQYFADSNQGFYDTLRAFLKISFNKQWSSFLHWKPGPVNFNYRNFLIFPKISHLRTAMNTLTNSILLPLSRSPIGMLGHNYYWFGEISLQTTLNSKQWYSMRITFLVIKCWNWNRQHSVPWVLQFWQWY